MLTHISVRINLQGMHALSRFSTRRNFARGAESQIANRKSQMCAERKIPPSGKPALEAT